MFYYESENDYSEFLVMSFHCTVHMGHQSIVTTLLLYVCAEVTPVHSDHFTTVRTYVQRGHLSIVTTLLLYVCAEVTPVHSDHFTTVRTYVQRGHVSIVTTLG